MNDQRNESTAAHLKADWDRWTVQSILSGKLAMLWSGLGWKEGAKRKQRLQDQGILDAAGRVSWEYLSQHKDAIARCLAGLRRDGYDSPDINQLAALFDQFARTDT